MDSEQGSFSEVQSMPTNNIRLIVLAATNGGYLEPEITTSSPLITNL